MTDIAIPPEALEAAARAICLGMGNNPDVLSCDGSGRVVWVCWEAEARAACQALLKAWPGMQHCRWNELNAAFSSHLILPLPKENSND